MNRRMICAALALVPLSVTAQSGPVRLLVGYAAGGPVDASARQFAPVLAKELGQNVVVENKPGANATLAVARARWRTTGAIIVVIPLVAGCAGSRTAPQREADPLTRDDVAEVIRYLYRWHADETMLFLTKP